MALDGPQIQIFIVVADDGKDGGKLAVQGFGIGLSNVRDRLKARFGDAASVDSGTVPGGYRTVIRLPLAVVQVLAHV